jgi:hypothetical protein
MLLEDKESENEIAIWKVGGWLQFRLELFELGAGVGSNSYVALSETINRMHNLTMGARVALSDTGEVVLVSDLLHSTANNDVVATIANQLLFLAYRLLALLEKIMDGSPSLSEGEIGEILAFDESGA